MEADEPATKALRLREKLDIEGLDHPQRMFDLTEGLIRRKHNDKDIELILGGNFKQVRFAFAGNLLHFSSNY